ncbi:HAD family hydrolase [Rhizobium sp. Leaf384]|uniref:HAD-IA family hydrolase n=1 Tax=unclassified Rhizobium TaxID=2613769 RepID=UPI000715F111|nr:MULTISPECIES: HAD-IA family hydrolase [unclassified Rhizobium]KQS80255.1 HAD family hydrolase [Rhizobium sp. Leaf384]KQS83457.1 HAD family hydrolase [Rhizobium sp. Leaf383]
MQLVLFDCDGTLVDSAGVIHATMAQTFQAFDRVPPSLEETKSIIGLTLDIAIARLTGEPHVDDRALAMTAHYKAIYADVRAAGLSEQPFAGIAALMQTLARRPDLVIGAVTGKSRRGLDMIRTAHGFDFRVSRTADDCPSKPHPAMVTECCAEAGFAPGDTLVIGDAIYDMQMAKSAGVTAIGVSWGYAPTSALLAAGANHIVETPDDILALLETAHA